MRVLFVSRWFPYPPTNGSKQRVYHLIRALAAQHEVSLISFADSAAIEPEAAQIRSLCASIETVPWREYRSRHPRAVLGLLASTPRSIVDTYSQQMATSVHRACANGRHAVVVASQIASASYHEHFAGLPAVFEEIELGVFDDRVHRASSTLARIRDELTYAKLRRYLGRVLRDMQACTVVSLEESMLVRRAIPSPPSIDVIPNGTTVPGDVTTAPHRLHNTLIFAGALTYAANADAVRWFLEDVYPTIQARRPATSVVLTGDTGGMTLSNPGVVQTGHVPDPRTLIAEAAVSIAPLRWGGGTRVKILEAMALGTPVVATPKAAEGLAVEHGVHLMIADGPQEFANCVLLLLGDTTLRQRLVNNARCLVAERYDWRLIGEQFVRLIERVARNGRASA